MNIRYFLFDDTMRQNKKVQNMQALISRKIKTFKPEEIKAAGGADIFGQLTGQNPKKALRNLMSIALTEEQYLSAIQIVAASK
jgi:hypothetical protein